MTDTLTAFFSLIRAGLWEQVDINLDLFETFGTSDQGRANSRVDWEKVYQLAEEQSVVGLVLAGIERYKNLNVNLNINQELLLQWIGEVQMLEQQNKDMNVFVAKLIEKLRKDDVYAILVKGQGVAQCYERPLWRASGDVDLLLSDKNYEKAKKVLLPIAVDVEREYKTFKHQGMTLDGGYVVELHGTLHSRLSKRIDKGLDKVQRDVFYGGNVRSWLNGHTSVFLPSPDNDVIFVFTHILHHFYIEGIGLRQICDWCRLLWTYKNSLNHELLEKRIRKMGLMSEWRAFAAFAVEYLGMPIEAMPLFNENDNHNQSLHRKAKHILKFVLESGNFGHNREVASGKVGSAWLKFKDFARHSRVFPLDSVKFFWHFLWDGLALAISK